MFRRGYGLDPTSVAASRRFVGESLADLPASVQEAAVLMVSELATNAIVHAITGFGVNIARTDSEVRVEVDDLGGGMPESRVPLTSDPHGRGVQIIQTLSDEWGVIECDGEMGKTVWFSVTLDPQRVGEGLAGA
jgi:two-component sensor histidine kinase